MAISAPTRRSLPRKAGQRQVQGVQTAMPPMAGINSSGAVANMPESDALELDNMLPTDLGMSVREGWREYATHVGGAVVTPVRTVMSYEGSQANATVSPIASSELFAVTDAGIYDVTGGGNMTAQPKEITLSGATYAGRMYYVQFTTDAGQYLVACSEIDGGFLYNGVAWMKMTSVGGPGPGVITGIDPVLFVLPCVYKKRLLFVQRGTSKVWILDVGSVGGVAKLFNFGPLMQHGGSITALMNWTGDAGEGTDDRLVVLGSSGDLLVYQGNDPTSALDFANTGVWYVGQPPVGRRCYTSTGGNPFVLTQFGVIPVNQVVQGGLDTIITAGTEQLKQLRKMQDALNADFTLLLNVLGWELIAVPSKAMLIIRKPSASINEHVMYVFQQHALAWSRFLDIPAATLCVRLNELYGGTDDGRVIRVLSGPVDALTLNASSSTEIRARMTPAFSYFGDPTTRKQALMVRPNFMASQAPGWSVRMNVDFVLDPSVGTPQPTTVGGALWDQSLWDAAIWASGRSAFGEWRAVEAFGYALTPSLFIATKSPVTLANIEYMLTRGGVL